MTIVLNLPESVGELAREEAMRRAQPLEDYLAEVVARTVPDPRRIARSLEILDSLGGIGDESDHRETYEALRKAEAEDGLSVRKRL